MLRGRQWPLLPQVYFHQMRWLRIGECSIWWIPVFFGCDLCGKFQALMLEHELTSGCFTTLEPTMQGA